MKTARMHVTLWAALAMPAACERGSPPLPPPPAVSVDAGAPGAVVASADAGARGAVVVSSHGTLTFTDADGRPVAAPVALAEGTGLATSSDGGAVVKLPDGRELSLGPNARVRFELAAFGSARVRVETGAVTTRGRVSLDVMTPFGITRLPNGDNDVSIEVAATAVRIDVRLGEMSFIDRAGKVTRIGPSGRIEVSVGGVRILGNAPAPQPEPMSADELPARLPESAVVLPTARGLRVYGDGLRTITVTWPGGGDADVDVAADAAFKSARPRIRATGGRLTLPAPRRGAVYWRVTRAGGATTVGDARFISDGATARGLAHPRNLVTDTGEKATVHFQGALPALTFAFTATPGAVKHQLRVYRADELDRPAVECTSEQLRCALAAGALAEGHYVWRATPLDANGDEIAGGRMNKLEIVYDNAVSRLEIESPQSGQRVHGGRVDVAGVAPLGSKLFVNGQPAALDEKGRFEMQVDRAPTVVFRLVTPSGAESYWVRTVRTRS